MVHMQLWCAVISAVHGGILKPGSRMNDRRWPSDNVDKNLIPVSAVDKNPEVLPALSMDAVMTLSCASVLCCAVLC